jgi:hypothetical protein
MDEFTKLTWWVSAYLTSRATGVPSTLRYKHEDLTHFADWFVWALGVDDVRRWNIAVSNAYVHALDSEVIADEKRSSRKPVGSFRWAARSKNRKIDHLRTFARWL